MQTRFALILVPHPAFLQVLPRSSRVSRINEGDVMRYFIELTVAFAVILIFAGSSYADLQPDNQTLQTQATQGDAKAQANLGWRYAEGLGGLPKDYAKAREWYEKAAAQGNKVAMPSVPTCLRHRPSWSLM
jgi:hypothetical protein